MEYQSELQIQSLVWRWFYKTYPEYRLPMVGRSPRCLLVHNLLNPKSRIEGAKLVGCGLTKGFPDLSLFVAKGGYHGLHIELKLPKQKARKEQIEVLEMLKIQGYQCVVCDSHDKAIAVIKKYLSDVA